MAYRILSIDGGGVKGIVPAIWLVKLEEELGDLKNHFDVICGTSTGAIVGAALSAGYTGAEIVDIFKIHAKEIFPSFFNRIDRILTNPFGPKYDHRPLYNILKRYFGGMLLCDLKVPFVTSAYDFTFGTPKIFYSLDNPNYSVVDVLRATCAAPIYFPPYAIKEEEVYHVYGDGALVMNNPSLFGVARYLADRKPGEEAMLLSLGTGYPETEVNAKEIENWNLFNWVTNIHKMIFDSSVDIVDQIVKQNMSRPGRHYVRFQTRFKLASTNIDNASDCNIISLESEAKDFLSSNQELVDKTIRLLKDNKK